MMDGMNAAGREKCSSSHLGSSSVLNSEDKKQVDDCEMENMLRTRFARLE